MGRRAGVGSDPVAAPTQHLGKRLSKRQQEWSSWVVTPTLTSWRDWSAFSLVRDVTGRPIDPSYRPPETDQIV